MNVPAMRRSAMDCLYGNGGRPRSARSVSRSRRRFGTAFGETVTFRFFRTIAYGARPREALGAKRLHVGVRVTQHAAIPLGEPLGVLARVDNIRPDRRGRYIHVGFQFRRPDGSVPVEIDHQSLILDPNPAPVAAAQKKPASPESKSEFEVQRRVQLTPEMVSGYSFEFPHLEAHHDPEAAAAIGMRAPIAQGLMGFTLLFNVLAEGGLSVKFDIEARFKRPIFWDDELKLEFDNRQLLRAVNGTKNNERALIHDWK